MNFLTGMDVRKLECSGTTQSIFLFVEWASSKSVQSVLFSLSFCGVRVLLLRLSWHTPPVFLFLIMINEQLLTSLICLEPLFPASFLDTFYTLLYLLR